MSDKYNDNTNLNKKFSTLNNEIAINSELKAKIYNTEKARLHELALKNSELNLFNRDLLYESLKPSLSRPREFPNASKQWINSVYSFNSNYIKNIPSADNTLNNIIKSFFNLNPLANNVNGKKSKLIKRRFKRLSLNKLFLSKSEIKHSNDKIHVTVYLFNKKKRSLIYKIKNLFSSLSFKPFKAKDIQTKKFRFKAQSSLKFKYFNSKSLNPGAKNTRNWIKSKKSLSALQKLNTINKKYSGINLKYLKKMYIKNLKFNFKAKNSMKYRKLNFLLYLQFNKLCVLNKNLRIVSKLNKLGSNNIKVKHGYYSELRRLKKKVLFKSYKKLYENLALVSKRKIYFKKQMNYRYYRFSRKNLYSRINKYSNTIHKASFNNRFLHFKPKNNIIHLKNKKNNILLAILGKKINKPYKNLIRHNIITSHNLALHTYKKWNQTNKTEHSLHLNTYKKYLEIKDKKSSLIKINKETNNLTSNKFKAQSFYRKKFRKYRFSKLYSASIKKILSYKKLNQVTKNSLYKFITIILPGLKPNKLDQIKISQNSALNQSNRNTVALKALGLYSKYSALPIAKNYYTNFNKYKLYKLSSPSARVKPLNLFNPNSIHADFSHSFKTSLNSINLFKTNSMPTMSMHKLKELYKLFTLYNNKRNLMLTQKLHTSQKASVISLNPSLNLNNMSSKLLINTYKLLKQFYGIIVRRKEGSLKVNSKRMQKYNKKSPLSLKYKYNYFIYKKNIKKSINNIKLRKAGKTVKNLYLKTFITLKKLKHKRKLRNIYKNLVRNAKNINILKNFKKIDRFFTRYISNDLVSIKERLSIPISRDNSLLGNKELSSNISDSHLRLVYKLNLLKLLFEKESIYLNYIKLLSFNNAIFKNWFLHNLKSTISKIYNKNVVLNIVNLKYIHLNSDILLNAIKIKLNNYRKNSVKRVLKLIINKIKISKVNKEFFNLNNEQYKNVLLHFNNYKTLNTDIFKDLNTNIESNNQLYYTSKAGNKLNKKLSYYNRPSKLKALNAIQYNTINFTKYKSLTGVRVQAAGRLTKRSTAARSILSLRYAGSLRNNHLINNYTPSILVNKKISNLEFTKITSKTRNGSFGVKGWISSN